jgi:hypothetical protein
LTLSNWRYQNANEINCFQCEVAFKLKITKHLQCKIKEAQPSRMEENKTYIVMGFAIGFQHFCMCWCHNFWILLELPWNCNKHPPLLLSPFYEFIMTTLHHHIGTIFISNCWKTKSKSCNECSTTIYYHHLLELSSCNLQKMNTLKHWASILSMLQVFKKKNRLGELGFWMVVIRSPRISVWSQLGYLQNHMVIIWHKKSYGGSINVKP